MRHQARVARGEKWRSPDAGFESCRANFAGNFLQPARKLGVGGIPIAERRLKTVVDLNYVERKLGAHRLERLEIGADRVFGDRVKVVVPGTPSALKRRAHPRVHPSAGGVGPSRGEARRGFIRSGDQQWIEFAMRARRQGYVVKDRTCDYFLGTRNCESRKRRGGADESGQHALRDIVAFDDREKLGGLRLGKFWRASRLALMIDARDEIGSVARMGLRRAYIVSARRAPRLVAMLEKSRRCRRREAGRDVEDRGSESNRVGAAIGDGRTHDCTADRFFQMRGEREAVAAGAGLIRGQSKRARMPRSVEEAQFDSRDQCVCHAGEVCKQAPSRQGTRLMRSALAKWGSSPARERESSIPFRR